MEKDTSQLSALWHKAKIVSEICIGIGALAIPIVIHLSTANYTNSLKEREISIRDREIGVRYVELATGILRADPDKQNIELRRYAINIIIKYSEVQLSDNAIKDLMQKKLPPSGFGASSFGDGPFGSSVPGDAMPGDAIPGN